MLRDRFHGQHSTDSEAAIAAFEQAVLAVAAHRPLGDALQKALSADPNLIAAHVLGGFGALLLGRAETTAAARSACDAATAAARSVKALSDSEAVLLLALREAVVGRLRRAAGHLEQHLIAAPEDFLAAKIAHALRFMLGDRNEMLRLTGHLVSSAPVSGAGYGFLMGCHAFGLEECGLYAEAEAVGRRAVALEPADSWGLHAVSHVFEMTGRVDEGRDWLNASRPVWSRCNNFSFHMAWHLALLHLEKGNHDAVLAIYDEEVRPVETDDFRDMSNAVSMLWRLEQEGVDVGDRWNGPAEIAYRRRTDTTYVFASLHYLLALIAAGKMSSAEELVEAMRSRRLDECDQGRVTRFVGLPVAEALIRIPGQRVKSGLCLSEMARRLPAIGGSHAQRDVFLRSLMAVAVKGRDERSLRAIASLRRQLRHEDRFHNAIMKRVNGGPAPTKPFRPTAHADHAPLGRLI